MSNEPRKATDVLLDLESKVDLLLSIVRSQDLNIKVLSNKLNNLIANGSKTQSTPAQPPVTVEAVNTANETPQIRIGAETQLPVENNPSGFRRNSRPETYSGDNAYLQQGPEPKFPVQLPKQAEIIVPKNIQQNVVDNTNVQQRAKPPAVAEKNIHMNSVPVQQRVVDKNGKSVFLADVEVINTENGEKALKSRTNGTGKWMGALQPGNYKVIISKRESLTKEKIDLFQDIKVDGKTSPLELPMLIFK